MLLHRYIRSFMDVLSPVIVVATCATSLLEINVIVVFGGVTRDV